MRKILWTMGLAALAACPQNEDAPSGGTPDAPVSSNPDAPVSSNPDAPAQSASGWRAIPMPETMDVRVTGIMCSSRDACIVATEGFSDPGNIYAASDHAVGAVVFDGANINAPAHKGGSFGFIGLDKTRNGVSARADTSGAYISATGDFTKASSWTIVDMGRQDGDVLPLNPMEALQVDAHGNWLFIDRDGFVSSATAAPSATTVWTPLWSPNAVPSVPADFEDLFAADPTLCDTDVSTRILPLATQNVSISQDLSVVVLPAGGLNQLGTAAPGVCISTDGGKHFFQSPFDGVPSADDVSSPGPLGVSCLDNDRCFAWNGLEFQDGTTYLYYSTDASMGKASHWTRATLPDSIVSSGEGFPRFIFFAPDGQHGWLGGAVDTKPMLLRTTDGGHTFTDVSAAVQNVTDQRLHSGFALDKDHIWVGGETGTLLFNDSAQQ